MREKVTTKHNFDLLSHLATCNHAFYSENGFAIVTKCKQDYKVLTSYSFAVIEIYHYSVHI